MEGILRYEGLISAARNTYLRYEGLAPRVEAIHNGGMTVGMSRKTGCIFRTQPLVTQIDLPESGNQPLLSEKALH